MRRQTQTRCGGVHKCDMELTAHTLIVGCYFCYSLLCSRQKEPQADQPDTITQTRRRLLQQHTHTQKRTRTDLEPANDDGVGAMMTALMMVVTTMIMMVMTVLMAM